ncbi:MAG: hypothetical protein Q7T89_15685, partial [Anaerolineales bacterium]|nr:hypothetical protein [Anaerolineales bacterium]
YTIQISTVNTFISTIVKTNTVASAFTPTIDLPANKPLFWRVIANGANGPSLPSDFFKFTTANPPPMPVLSAPVDNTLITNTLTPELDWANVTVPATIAFGGYQLQVATDAAFSSVILTQNVAGGPAISKFVIETPLSPNTKYYWRVRSYDSGSHYSSWSLVRSFRMVMPAPTLLLPANEEVALQPNRPFFDWEDVPSATGYTIQISTVNTFTSFVLNTPATGSTYTPVKDLPANKSLFWRVIANGANGPSLPSGFFKFTTANPPPMPVLSAPVDNLLITNTLTPKLDWVNVTVPATITFGGYQLEVATDAAFSSVILTQNVAGGRAISKFVIETPLSENTKYYWRVRSYDSDSDSHYSSWSLVRSFRMVMPAPTTLTQPGNGATLQTIRPTFDWEDAPGATGYTIQISTVNTFASFVLNTPATGSTHTPVKDLPANKLLFWRVIANGLNGPSAPSAYLSFTTGALPPSIPVLSAPTDNLLISDTLTPKLDWANVTVPAGVTFGKYQLEVATDAAFSSVVVTQDVTGGLAASEFALTALSPNTKYYWRVRSVNSLGHFSGWSLARSFRIAMLAPTLVSPTGALTTADLTPAFDWDDVEGASYYSIQISTTSTFTSTLVNITASSSTFTPTVDLPANTALYWRVLAQGANGPGKWSAHNTFIMQ